MVDIEIAPWIKGIPVAPEYHPSESELSDPITFALRIQEQVTQFGICKVVPPISKQPRKSLISSLTRCIAQAQAQAQAQTRGRKKKPDSNPRLVKFRAQTQTLGIQQNPDSQKSSSYTLEEFEAKAKAFARGKLGTTKDPSPLMVESLFWEFMMKNQHTFVECSDDIPGSAFPELDPEDSQKKGWKLSSSAWNLRYITELQGSLLKLAPPDKIPAPILCISMLFAWSSWRTEEQELHGLSYLHSGASKSWYSVPPEAAAAFEDVVRNGCDSQGARGLSPEVMVSSGVPCCRLVQNAGEFVMIFPGSYHLSFSHGFNCGELCKFPTPSWLRAAREARRLPVDRPPLFCQEQLLYQAALGSSSSSTTAEFRSSRLKQRKKICVDEAIKAEFSSDVFKTRQLLDKLLAMAGSKCLSLAGNLKKPEENEKENLCNLVNLGTIDSISLLSFVCNSMERLEEKPNTNSSPQGAQSPRLDWGALSCELCGILCYSSIVIVQPRSPESSRKRTRRPTGGPKALAPAILCPEHALQASLKLQGSRALVVCHPEYQTFHKLAKQIMGDEFRSKELRFDEEAREDHTLLSSAIEGGGAGWISGLELTPEKKPVTSLESDEDDDEEVLLEKNLKEKKCWVVGRWCGREWRYNQTHALLGDCIGSNSGASEAAEVPQSSTKRKASSDDVSTRNEELASSRKNSRKRRRTQVSSEQRTEESQQEDEDMRPEPAEKQGTSSEAPQEPGMIEAEESSLKQDPGVEAGARAQVFEVQNSDLGAEEVNQHLWHEVPITLSTTLRSTLMQRCNTSRLTPASEPLSPNHPMNGSSRDDEEEENESFSGETPEVSEEEELDQETRTKRTIRKSWKAEAAMENDRGKACQMSPIEPPSPAPVGIGGTKRGSRAGEHPQMPVFFDGTGSDTEEVHPCEMEGCRMRFRSAEELALHKRNLCTVKGCRKRFCSHNYLMQHYRVHADDRPLKCPWKGCKKSFKWAWARTEHIRVHTGERPYTCSVCGKCYRFVSDFSRHKRSTGHSASA